MASWPEIVNVKTQNRHELILSGKEISQRIEKGGISPDLFSCTGLNFLQVSETCLSSIPAQIRVLDNLTSLILHSNNLNELCLEIGELSKLKILDASNNKLKNVDKALSKLTSLTTLNLSFNEIAEVPVLSNNKWLSIIDFSSNLIEDMSEFCHENLIHLAELHLKRNKIKEIPLSITHLTALKLLDLSDNLVTQIPGELGDNTKLKDINLQGNPLSDKRLLKLVVQNKSKPIVDYIKERCERKSNVATNGKGKKGKNKARTKSECEASENVVEASAVSIYQMVITKSEDLCRIKRTEKVQNIRPQIIACVLKNVSFSVESLKKFIQLQSKLHDGICDKRKSATIATHDLDLTKGKVFTYTAVPPDELRIVPLFRNKEFTGKELFTQLQAEAESLRKEKKRNTCSGIHKFLQLSEGDPLYACLLNAEGTVISFPPITNSEVSKISVGTKNILVEVTSSISQNMCKKVLNKLLKDMLLSELGSTTDEKGNRILFIEQVRIEDVDGNLIAVYPSNVDLKYEDDSVTVVRS